MTHGVETCRVQSARAPSLVAVRGAGARTNPASRAVEFGHHRPAVHAAAVRHHVGVPVLLHQLQLENAVWQAARAMRTGQLQQSTGRLRRPPPRRRTARTPSSRPCAPWRPASSTATRCVVIVQSNANFGGIVEPNCATNGVMINDSPPPPSTPARPAPSCSSPSATPGTSAASCRSSRSATCRTARSCMQASAAFRTEPYN